MRFEADGTPLGSFATHPTLGSPEGITFLRDGSLLVSARTESVVVRFDGASGDYLETVTEAPVVDAPEGMGTAPDGTVWISSRDNHAVIQFDPSTSPWSELSRVTLDADRRPIGLEISPVDGVIVALRGVGAVQAVP